MAASSLFYLEVSGAGLMGPEGRDEEEKRDPDGIAKWISCQIAFTAMFCLQSFSGKLFATIPF